MSLLKQDMGITNCKSRKIYVYGRARISRIKALPDRGGSTRIFLHVNDVKEYLLIIKEKGGELDGLTSGRKNWTFL